MTNQVAIAVGLAAGLLLGIVTAVTGADWMEAIVAAATPVGTAFINLVRMVVIPLVVTTLFTGVAGLSEPKRVGRMGARTLGFFWATTFIAIAIGMSVTYLALEIAPVRSTIEAAERAPVDLPTTVDFLLSLIPANPFAAAARGELLPLIVFTLLFGAAAGRLPAESRTQLVALADGVSKALIVLVHWVLWTAPVGVFALALPVAAEAGFDVLRSLFIFVLAVTVGLALFLGLVYLGAVQVFGSVDATTFARGAVGAQVIAMSTTSSPATLPAMLEACEERYRVSRVVAGFVVALGASINRAGSALFQGSAIVFLAALYDVTIAPSQIGAAILATFFVSLTVTGVPSSSLVTLAPALEVASVPLAGISILFGIDRIPDMLRTAVNVTGSMAAATIVERTEYGSGRVDRADHQSDEPEPAAARQTHD